MDRFMYVLKKKRVSLGHLGPTVEWFLPATVGFYDEKLKGGYECNLKTVLFCCSNGIRISVLLRMRELSLLLLVFWSAFSTVPVLKNSTRGLVYS
jgi:hypothetical protein